MQSTAVLDFVSILRIIWNLDIFAFAAMIWAALFKMSLTRSPVEVSRWSAPSFPNLQE